MKYIVVLADGMADEPIDEFNGLTPVMAAKTPIMDEICRLSVTGLVNTIPEGFHPGSEIANMNILGYRPAEYYQGRGVLEAAALGLKFDAGDLVLRCNLVSAENGVLLNHSAGHISTAEADELIKALNNELGNEKIRFYTGVSYRHILVIKDANHEISCTPPHDHPGEALEPLLPVATSKSGEVTTKVLNDLIKRSKKILAEHPVNVERRKVNKKCADMIWPWSQGYAHEFKSFNERFGIKSGAVISAVDLIHGIGKLAGLESVHVDGATGLFDTNYEGKAEAAIKALKRHPFVFLHVEAMDEAGHEGDCILKRNVIEDFDRRLLKPLWENLQNFKEEFSLLLLPDHPTPCYLRTHTSLPVPFMMLKPGMKADQVDEFNEESVKTGAMGKVEGEDLLDLFFGNK